MREEGQDDILTGRPPTNRPVPKSTLRIAVIFRGGSAVGYKPCTHEAMSGVGWRGGCTPGEDVSGVGWKGGCAAGEEVSGVGWRGKHTPGEDVSGMPMVVLTREGSSSCVSSSISSRSSSN